MRVCMCFGVLCVSCTSIVRVMYIKCACHVRVTCACFRDMEDVEPDAKDAWATREFFVKWKRHSYVHCTWVTRATMSTMAGYKRVLNYIKKQTEIEVGKKKGCTCVLLVDR